MIIESYMSQDIKISTKHSTILQVPTQPIADASAKYHYQDSQICQLCQSGLLFHNAHQTFTSDMPYNRSSYSIN